MANIWDFLKTGSSALRSGLAAADPKFARSQYLMAETKRLQQTEDKTLEQLLSLARTLPKDSEGYRRVVTQIVNRPEFKELQSKLTPESFKTPTDAPTVKEGMQWTGKEWKEMPRKAADIEKERLAEEERKRKRETEIRKQAEAGWDKYLGIAKDVRSGDVPMEIGKMGAKAQPWGIMGLEAPLAMENLLQEPEVEEKEREFLRQSNIVVLEDPANPGQFRRGLLDEEGNFVDKGAATERDIKAAGVSVSIGKPAPSGERESINKLLEFQSELQRIEDLYSKEYVGRLQGPLGAGKEFFGAGVTERESSFRQIVKNISDTLLRLRSGAQINEQEYQRLLKLVPTPNLPDTVFRARLKSLKTAINNSIRIRQRTLEQSGFIAPNLNITKGQALAELKRRGIIKQ